METPLVSICCLVYNHEPFLRECFEGFVMQKTTFPIEVLVHDDASTDRSADIIREYTEKYPDIFKPIFQTENQYSKGKGYIGLQLNFERAQGKYIAMCEGDDYWTDPLKLQKQVDFLEKNEDFAICGTNSKYKAEGFDYDGELLYKEEENKIFVKEDFYRSNHLATCTVMLRANTLQNLTKDVFPFGDWCVYLTSLFANNQKAILLSVCTAVYRVHTGGVYSGCDEIILEKRHIIQLLKLQKLFNYEKDEKFLYSLNCHFEEILKEVNTLKELFKYGFWFWSINKGSFPCYMFLKYLRIMLRI